MKAIGGFYELLLPEGSLEYHKDAVALTNGRACIRTMIQNLNIAKCYVPNYTCDAVYHPFDLEGIAYELYPIDENMEPVSLPELGPNEYFFYINYFGVNASVTDKLYQVYGDKLLIDNTHDFSKQRQFDCWSFTSARKYFGVPDGAFLYAPKEIVVTDTRFQDYSLTHSVERLKGNQTDAFSSFRGYEKSLNAEVARISVVSEHMLSLVDMDKVKRKRRQNFETLQAILGDRNTLQLKELGEEDMPYSYPFLPTQNFAKDVLYPDNIFVPTLWADCLKRDVTTPFEKVLAENLLPLPIDERYDTEDMKFMAERIIGVLEK